MPKNLGLYNNTLSVPRKKDIDAVQDTVDMHDSDIQQLESDVNGLNTEVGAVKTALTSKQNKITGAASTVVDDNLTASRVVVSNGSGKIAASSTPDYMLDRINKEAYLTWGGRNISGGYGPIDAAMIPVLGANRLAFMPVNGVTYEYSRDGGTTWETYDTSDTNKTKLFCGTNDVAFVIGGQAETGVDKSNHLVRFIIDSSVAKVYTQLNKFAIYISTNGSSGCYCTIDCRTNANYTAGTDTWVTFANQVSVAGWPGWNIINTNNLTTYSNNDTQYRQVRFTFGCTSQNTTYGGLRILGISGFGGAGWRTPSNLAQYGTIYTYDSSQNVNFPAAVTATRFNGKVAASNVEGLDYPVDSVNGKTGAVTLSASDVGALPDDTVIPTVNDATLTIQKNGTSVGTFSANASSNKTVNITVPTNNNELTNGAGYITNSSLTPYAKTADIPTKTSDLINNSEFITSAQAPVQSVDGATGTVVLNDVKYTTQTLTDAQKTQARTNIGAGTSSFSGNYNDLSNKPTIPTVNNGVLTIQKNGTDVATFGANNSANVTANITVPTSKSDVGLGNVDNVKQYSASNPPPYPVTSVNGQTGAVTINVDLSTVLKLTGGTMQGVIDMGGYKITNVATPTNNTDAANKAYADAQKGVEVLTQSTQPTDQVSGDMWFQTT